MPIAIERADNANATIVRITVQCLRGRIRHLETIYQVGRATLIRGYRADVNNEREFCGAVSGR